MESNQLAKRASDMLQDVNMSDPCDDSMKSNQMQNMVNGSTDLLQHLNICDHCDDSMESTLLLNRAKQDNDFMESTQWQNGAKRFSDMLNDLTSDDDDDSMESTQSLEDQLEDLTNDVDDGSMRMSKALMKFSALYERLKSKAKQQRSSDVLEDVNNMSDGDGSTDSDKSPKAHHVESPPPGLTDEQIMAFYFPRLADDDEMGHNM